MALGVDEVRQGCSGKLHNRDKEQTVLCRGSSVKQNDIFMRAKEHGGVLMDSLFKLNLFTCQAKWYAFSFVLFSFWEIM